MAIMKKHSGANNHGTNAVAQFKLDVNNITYHTFMLDFFAGTTVATVAKMKNAVSKIQLTLNGKVQQEWSISDLLAYNSYNFNMADTAGKLELHLRDSLKQTIDGQDLTAYGMLDTENAQLEVFYTSHADAGDMTCDLHFLKGKGTKLGLHTTVTPINGFSAVVGNKAIRDLNIGSGILRMLQIDTDKIDAVLLKVGDVVLHESTKTSRERLQTLAGRKTIAGYTFIDFDIEKRIANGIPRNTAIDLTITATDVVSSFKIIEIVDTPELVTA